MAPKDKELKECEATQELCNIDKSFVPYKAHYFLLNAAHVGVIPYLPVYAKSALGCSATTIGLLATLMQLSSTISKPLFGLLADCLNKLKILIATLLCIEVVVNLLMLSLPRVDLPQLEIHYQPPIDNNHILRFAPSRAYDASVGLHKKPKHMNHDYVSPDRQIHKEVAHTYISDNLTVAHNGIAYWVKSNMSSNDNNVNLCQLRCNDVIDAVCYQSSNYCIDDSSENTLPCTQLNNTSGCEGFETNVSFTFTFEVNNTNSPTNLQLVPRNYVYYYHYENKWISSSCNKTLESCSLVCEGKHKFCSQGQARNVFGTYQFWIFCLFALMGAMCQGASYTLSDTVCYEKIRGSKTDFGKQRLWGAVGWGVVAPLTGYLNDLVTSKGIQEDYSSGWYIMAILSFFLLLNLYCMEFPEPAKSSSMWTDVKGVLTNRSFICMVVNAILLGIFNAYSANYVIWYMEMLGSSRMAMGLALGVECLFGEAPFMFFSEYIISKFGHWNVVTLTFIAFSVRFGAYYFIVNPWMILPVELLNGITFGLFYTTMTSFAEKIAPIGTEATIQGIIGGMYFGLGSGIGCLLAGLSFDKFGGRRSFFLVAIFSAIFALGHGLLCLVFQPNSDYVEKVQETEESA